MRAAIALAAAVLCLAAAIPLAPAAAAESQCTLQEHVDGGPDQAVGCLRRDVPCLPHPCG